MAKKDALWRMTKRFFAPLWEKEHRKYTIIVLISSLFASFLEVFNVVILEKIAFYLEKQEVHQTYFWVGLLFLIALVIFVHKTFDKAYAINLVSKLAHFLDTHYLVKYLKLDNTYAETIGTGRMISIIRGGTLFWSDLLWSCVWGHGRKLFAILFAFSYIALKGWYFALFVFWILWACYLWMKFFNHKPFFWRKKRKQILIEIDRLITKRIMSKFEILYSWKYHKEVAINYTLNEEWRKVTFTEKIWQGICYDGIKFLTAILSWVLIVYVVIWVFSGQFVFSDFVLFSSLSVLLIQKTAAIADIAKDVNDKFIHISKLWEVVDHWPQLENLEKGKTFQFKEGNITIKNLTFAYDTAPVFKNFSLSLQWGTKTAFVGESWGGKTTLMKLLAGYIKAQSGTIKVDGQDLEQVKLTEYYQHIGYLSQEPSVFDGTIYENLIYALATEPDSKTLERVIKLAKCDFIWEFKKGLDTEIGERGIRLSGGQKQRLAIAKIMLKNPSIILLDEPTSALDSVNEEQVGQALNNLFKGKTVLVVAHRLQTVKSADRILFIEQGKVLEDWTHKELTKLNGKYKKMLDLQSGF